VALAALAASASCENRGARLPALRFLFLASRVRADASCRDAQRRRQGPGRWHRSCDTLPC